jgi:hypothetical protein
MRHTEPPPNKRHMLSPSGLHELCDAHERTSHDVHHSGSVREDGLQHDEGQGPGYSLHPQGIKLGPYQTAVSEHCS